MKIPKGYKVFVYMVGAAVVFMLVGYFMIRKNLNYNPTPLGPQSDSQAADQNTTPTPAADPTPTPTPAANPIPSDWLTYTNTKYNYTLQYPPNLKVGSVSGNSVLGDFANPVKGFHVGPLVLVTLKGDMRATGADYFNQSYNVALHPPAATPGGSGGGCTIDKIINTNVTVQSVSCTGEGGAARYALIKGLNFDVFVDGYSKGFDNTNNGDFTDSGDYNHILSTFKFAADNMPGVLDPKPAAAVQSFTVVADDNGALPAEITVPKGTIVDLTFNVSYQNVNGGGLQFSSTVANSGVIQPGANKTVAFTANQSFSFTPSRVVDGVTRPYTVKVTVQ